MPKVMEIFLPDEISEYEGQLRYFVDTMVAKLHTNRHKKFASADLDFYLVAARDEIEEAESARANEGQHAFMVECADASNMLWLASLKAMNMTREEWDQR